MSPFRSIAVENRRRALAAALALFGLLAAHTVLEVARDSLFLARLPAEQLPFTYLAIAGAAWVAAQADRLLLERFDERRVAVLTLLGASAGTAGFYTLFERDAFWVPHAFYVWTGLVATFAVAQFWRLLANYFTVGEAKRLYAPIAAGGSLGAVAGAGLASLLDGYVEARGLLLVGAAILVVTAALPGLGIPREATAAAPRRRESGPPLDTHPRRLRYVRLLLVLVTLTASTAVLVDYVFKAAVDATLPAEELGTFFSHYYVVVNVISLIVQIAVAPRLLAILGAQRSLVVLPALLALGAVGAVVSGGLVSASILRGTDGALRHSLHRSAVELLYLPLSRAMRERYKATIDALGQRGGQAIGSLAILVAGAAELGTDALALLVAGAALAWAGLALSLRGHYLDLFRQNLRAGTIETRVEVPELDLVSLESMMASLNSPWDEEVLATLDLLEEYGRARVIPALILYHPSRDVVLRALEIFAASARAEFVPVARRLLSGDDDEIAAATMRALAAMLSPEELRGELAVQRRPAVRAAVLAGLAARGLDRDGSAAREIEECALATELAVRLSLARAIRLEGDRELGQVLHRMTEAPAGGELEPELARELALAFGALRDAAAIPWLLTQLGPRRARGHARDALLAIGEPALEALIEALGDTSLPPLVRLHLPRSLSRFDDARAAAALFACLREEEDGWVRYKALRGLGGLRQRLPEVRFDSAALETLIRAELRRAAELLATRIAVVRAQDEDEARRTRAGALLAPILREKEQQSLDRAVRLIALAHPDEDLRRLQRGLKRGDRRRRAESRELLVAVTPVALAGVIDALLDEAPDPDRLERARLLLEVPTAPRTYVGVLQALMEDRSDAVRCIAAHHAGELSLTELATPLASARDRATGLARDVIDGALEAIQGAFGEARDAAG